MLDGMLLAGVLNKFSISNGFLFRGKYQDVLTLKDAVSVNLSSFYLVCFLLEKTCFI